MIITSLISRFSLSIQVKTWIKLDEPMISCVEQAEQESCYVWVVKLQIRGSMLVQILLTVFMIIIWVCHGDVNASSLSPDRDSLDLEP